MIQDIKDRLPTKPNTWEVTHSDSTVEEVTVARADEPTEVGTPINSALFKNLQGDVYTGIQYNTPTYSGNDMTLDLPLTSYEVGKIINIISPATFSSNPTLNVNGLGAKTVNALLTLNQKYSLIYNGSSFDVISNISTNKYYPMIKSTGTTDIANENIIPTTGWEETTTNTYTSNGVVVSADSSYSSFTPNNAVDGNTSTYWAGGSSGTYINYKIELPQAIKINKMKAKISSVGGGGTFSCNITGSNDDTTWSGSLYSTNTRLDTLTEITMYNPQPYKYYKIQVYASSSRPAIHELQVSDYTAYLFTADYPLTSVNDKFQINVIPNEDGLSLGKNYLLLSGLGTAKEVEGTFKANELCTLIYNGTKFIKLIDITPTGFTQNLNKNISFKQGTASNGTTIPQTLGFTNYLYFVSPNSLSSSYRYQYSGSGTFYPYDSLGINCSVDQATRVVTCTAQVTGTTASGGTANYLEIAWN